MEKNTLEAFRQSNGLTYASLAQLAGLAQSLVYYHCSGKRRISAEMAVHYEKLLGIPRENLRPDLWEKNPAT